MTPIAVGILGATGTVGQSYARLLADHPWFDLCFMTASKESAGMRYGDALAERHGTLSRGVARFADRILADPDDVAEAKGRCRFLFSALPGNVVKAYEELYARNDLPVISNNSRYRGDEDVPLLIPEVNADHAEVIHLQRKRRGWKRGCIVTKPNCSLQSYVLPLTPLHRTFTVVRLCVTTLQAVSGAGSSQSSSLDMEGDIIPYIPSEEEKSENEPLKVWGRVGKRGIVRERGIAVSAHCNRVPVRDGHLACVSVAFVRKPERGEVLDLWRTFRGPPQTLALPSAPDDPIVYVEGLDRPRPRYDKDRGRGMSVTVGRLRSCPLFDYRFTALSHNVIRGAAGGGILTAEYLVAKEYI
ncbi:MAG: aspartate-semialdehyde dehydrogenase [Simkaniaceae bacterium]|nr:aspartate-semialdehyde dehydrogenase [Simkaniaceae bacterium]